MRVLVLYVFHVYNERVVHFIKNCIFHDDGVDFIIISNDISITINAPPYVKIMKRHNIGYDFGGWSDALLTNNLYSNYDKFIFVNSSVIGPFIKSNVKWTDIYLNGLVGNVKLFGSTINTICNPIETAHVQSYIFAMDKTTLNYLIKLEIFSMTKYAITFDDAICNKEVVMSRQIIKNGWNIGSLLPCYKNVDFTFKEKSPSDYGIPFVGDVLFSCYRNVLWNEYQLVFVKGNRPGLPEFIYPRPKTNTNLLKRMPMGNRTSMPRFTF